MSSFNQILKKYIPNDKLEFLNNSIFGLTSSNLTFSDDIMALANFYNIELKGYSLLGDHTLNTLGIPNKSKNSPENRRESNQNGQAKAQNEVIRVGLFQNSISEATNEPIEKQKNSLLELGATAISIAAKCNVNIFCFQELWNMPMAFCTQKKLPWIEFAESCSMGPTTILMKKLAKENEMVIISSILERDEKDFLWNTAVIIDADGEILGISRKQHIPISGKFSEAYYYQPSTLGIPVFQTKFARIGMTICYDRHHPQNWYTHRLNQAQIVFNPSATVQTFSEPFWGIEARNAASTNGYFVCAINRTGTEHFQISDDKFETAGPFFGSSYITAPDGTRTPGLSNDKNGILIGDLNLSSCIKFEENLEDLDKLSKYFINYDKY